MIRSEKWVVWVIIRSEKWEIFDFFVQKNGKKLFFVQKSVFLRIQISVKC
jgi:hypothetical protein